MKLSPAPTATPREEKYIYSEPIIPHLNDKKIIAELANIKLTKTESERNSIIETAYETAINNYTCRHMAINLLSHIEEIECHSKS